MLIKAEQKFTRQATRKVRLIANTVKKLSLENAFQQLAMINRRATIAVAKVLRQAVANAQHNFNLKPEQLKIDNIEVMEGPRYRRFQAASRGRAHGLIKRTSHVRVTLKPIE
jgi:large subunit ribosomal protein L22